MKILEKGQIIKISGYQHNNSENGTFEIVNIVPHITGKAIYDWTRIDNDKHKNINNKTYYNHKRHGHTWVERLNAKGNLIVLK